MTPDFIDYLDRVRRTPFEWGVHDCLVFTNTCWRHLHGCGWADDVLDRYHRNGRPLGPKALRRIFPVQSIAEFIDGRLNRVEGVPPRGSLVAANLPKDRVLALTLGLCVGDRSVFLTDAGLRFDDVETAVAGWVC